MTPQTPLVIFGNWGWRKYIWHHQLLSTANADILLILLRIALACGCPGGFILARIGRGWGQHSSNSHSRHTSVGGILAEGRSRIVHSLNLFADGGKLGSKLRILSPASSGQFPNLLGHLLRSSWSSTICRVRVKGPILPITHA